jgi:hypothetical protein
MTTATSNSFQIRVGAKYIYGIAEIDSGATTTDSLIQKSITAPLDAGYAEYQAKTSDGNKMKNILQGGFVGIHKEKVHMLYYKDLAAVVSNMPLAYVQRMKTDMRLGGKNGISYILAHQQVVESIRRAGFVILPVRFGTVGKEAEVRKLLSEQYNKFKLKIARFKDKDEIGIRIITSAAADKKFSERVQESAEIKRVKQLIQQQSSHSNGREGSLYFSNLRLNDLIRNQKFKLIDGITMEIHQKLATRSDAWSELSKETQQTIFNRTYLVDRSRSDEFNAAIEYVRQNYCVPYEMAIYRSGPWAPYSFCMDSGPVSFSNTDPVSRNLSQQNRGSSKQRYRLVKRDGR